MKQSLCIYTFLIDDLDNRSTTKPISRQSYRLTTEGEEQHKKTKHDEMSTFNNISTKKSTLLSTDETTRAYIVIIISILFSFLLCLPYMGERTLPCKLYSNLAAI